MAESGGEAHPHHGAAGGSASGRLDQARLELARMTLVSGVTLSDTFRRLTQVAADALQVNRVSVWRFLDGRNAIRCEYLHQGSQFGGREGAILHRRDFPGYFEAIESRRIVSVADAEGDPHSSEFREVYFKPLGIRAMLDCPVFKAGEPIGIVCHEQIDRVRVWTREEQEFAAAVADAFGRISAEAEWASARMTVETMQDRFDQLERTSALGRLAAGIAHDFRNILTTAMGYVDLMSDPPHGDDGTHANLREISSALEAGVRLTEELTAFGQSDPSQPKVVDVCGLLERFRGMLHMAAGPHVNLQIDLAQGTDPVFMDEGRLERILLNLVLNAKDAMPKGGVLSIRLRSFVSPKASPHAIMTSIEVEDTGVGMTAETRRRIFEPYFTTKGEKGTGLGLAIVNQCIVQAGGFLEVDSEMGRGTVFRIYLPGIAAGRDHTGSRD